MKEKEEEKTYFKSSTICISNQLIDTIIYIYFHATDTIC